jgi:hypothetical protein
MKQFSKLMLIALGFGILVAATSTAPRPGTLTGPSPATPGTSGTAERAQA